jgi:hypothetical protein
MVRRSRTMDLIMSELKKYYENKKKEWVKITKTRIGDNSKPEYMYLLEWEYKNDHSYDTNFYTYYKHALADFEWRKNK